MLSAERNSQRWKQKQRRITNSAWKTSSKTHLQLGQQQVVLSDIPKTARLPASVTKMRLAKVPCLKYQSISPHLSPMGTFMKLHDHFLFHFKCFRFRISDFPKMPGTLAHCAYRRPCLQVRLAVLRNLLIGKSSFLMFFHPCFMVPYGHMVPWFQTPVLKFLLEAVEKALFCVFVFQAHDFFCVSCHSKWLRNKGHTFCVPLKHTWCLNLQFAISFQPTKVKVVR